MIAEKRVCLVTNCDQSCIACLKPLNLCLNQVPKMLNWPSKMFERKTLASHDKRFLITALAYRLIPIVRLVGKNLGLSLTSSFDFTKLRV